MGEAREDNSCNWQEPEIKIIIKTVICTDVVYDARWSFSADDVLFGFRWEPFSHARGHVEFILKLNLILEPRKRSVWKRLPMTQHICFQF